MNPIEDERADKFFASNDDDRMPASYADNEFDPREIEHVYLSNNFFQSQDIGVNNDNDYSPFDHQILPQLPPAPPKLGFLTRYTKIFNIVREELPSQLCKSEESEKVNPNKSRIIQKREKAKSRKLAKIEASSERREKVSALNTDNVSSSSVDVIPSSNPLTHRKIKKMVRNRIAAQNSRDRKKAYLDSLEKENNDLKAANIQLQERIDELEKFQEAHRQQMIELPSETAPEEAVCSLCGRINQLNFGPEPNNNTDGTTSDSEHPLNVQRSNVRGYGPSRAAMFSLFALISLLLTIGFYTINSGKITFDFTTGRHESRLMTQKTGGPIVSTTKTTGNSPLNAGTSNYLAEIRSMKDSFDKKMQECDRKVQQNEERLKREKKAAERVRNPSSGPKDVKNRTKLRTQVITEPRRPAQWGSLVCPAGAVWQGNRTGSSLSSQPSAKQESLFYEGQTLQILVPARNITIMSADGKYLVPSKYNEQTGLVELICKISDMRTVATDQ